MSSLTLLGTLGVASADLPFYSAQVPAGFPSPAQDHLERQLSLDELLELRAPHTYLVRASGHSMRDAGIFDGDILVVDRAQTARSGAVIIAALNGEVLVKQLHQTANLIQLVAAHPDYPARTICEADDFQVWGVVRYSLHRHSHA